MRRKLIPVLLMFFLAIIPTNILAVTKKTTRTAAKTSGDVSVSMAVNKGGTGVTVYFKNAHKASSIQYYLNYSTNGKQEGAGGTIDTGKKYSLSRTLLFATCSSGVCRYHSGIKDAKLTVVITYKSGKTVSRTYPINISSSKRAKTTATTKKPPIGTKSIKKK